MLTRKIILSPIRSPEGRWRLHEDQVPCAPTLAKQLEAGDWSRAILNGGVIDPEHWQRTPVKDGDELLLIPAWGGPEQILVLVVFQLLLSAIFVGASVLLAPTPEEPLTREDEPTFGFEGISTTRGPGRVVPVVYGRRRVGGQLISADVEENNVISFTSDDNLVEDYEISSGQGFSTNSLNMVLALAEGEIQEIEESTIEINDQPIANFPDVTIFTRLGTPGQTAFPRASGVSINTFAVGAVLDPETASGKTTYITSEGVNISRFALNLTFNKGLFNINQDGTQRFNSVDVRFRWRDYPAGTFNEFNIVTFRAFHTSAFHVALERESLTPGRFEIEVEALNARHLEAGTEATGTWPTLTSVTEQVDNGQAYPDTALIQFRKLVTDDLGAGLPNVTVIIKGRKVRVGAVDFGSGTETYSQNPAWCLLDLMTNTRYGLQIADAEIDITAFTTYANYCDELVGGDTRHVLNYVLDRELRAQPALMEILGMSRTALVKSAGLWSPRVSRDETPVQLLSWANCANVSLTYTRDVDRTNVIEAQFADEDEDFEVNVLTHPDIDNWPAVVRKDSVRLRGITSRNELQRALQFELNQRQLSNVFLECESSLEALVLQAHDVFRFSHPLPGWGTSGRIAAGANTTSHAVLDEDVTFVAGNSYHLYVRHDDDVTEVKDLINPGNLTTREVDLQGGQFFSKTPVPGACLWAFGQSSPSDTAIRPFRVRSLEHTARQTIRIRALLHNSSVYTEPTPVTPAVISDLWNPLGPPPAIIGLTATELSRVQSNGSSRVVVHLAWDYGPVTSGLAPYGGARIYRREVTQGSGAGIALMGQSLTAETQTTGTTVPFQRLANVQTAQVHFDDPTVTTGQAYEYRVIPVSRVDIANNNGDGIVAILVTGPTSPGFFPGTPQNLRLLGKAVGITEFDGPDVICVWDPVPDNGLFDDRFLVQDYRLEVWGAGQAYLLHGPVFVSERQFTLTLEQNTVDSAQAGFATPRRQCVVRVWARTRDNRESITPASISIDNPAPDMSAITPQATVLFEAALIDWSQFAEPRDFVRYEVRLDTVTPPVTLYDSNAPVSKRIFLTGLTAGTTYYAQVVPYDTFGIGIASQIVSFVPAALDAGSLDTTAPATPTGLVLTPGVTISDDGAAVPFVEANWDDNTESDLDRYQVNFRIGSIPSALTTTESQVRLDGLPGGVTVNVKVAAIDKFGNASAFTSEVSTTTGTDGVAPADPTGLSVTGFFRSNVLSWSLPADSDLGAIEIHASQTNDRATSTQVGEVLGAFFTHGNLAVAATWYYWIRARDRSGNLSNFVPAGATAGAVGTTARVDSGDIIQASALITQSAQIQNAIINNGHISDLSADKITAGNIDVLVTVAVGGNIDIDGVNNFIKVRDSQTPTPVERVHLGKLQPTPGDTDYGLRVYNEIGQIMFDASTGGVTANGISAAVIDSTHLRTDIAVITNTAQIANAVIQAANIANATITGAQIAGATITSANIQDATIAGADIASATITTANIGNAQITNALIGDLEVDNAKIANLTVETAKIANNAITAVSFFRNSGFRLVSSASPGTEIGTVTQATNGNVVIVEAKFSCRLDNGDSAIFTLRKDTVTGTVLDNLVLENIGSQARRIRVSGVLFAVDSSPSATQTYKVVGRTISGQVSVERRAVTATNLKK